MERKGKLQSRPRASSGKRTKRPVCRSPAMMSLVERDGFLTQSANTLLESCSLRTSNTISRREAIRSASAGQLTTAAAKHTREKHTRGETETAEGREEAQTKRTRASRESGNSRERRRRGIVFQLHFSSCLNIWPILKSRHELLSPQFSPSE